MAKFTGFGAKIEFLPWEELETLPSNGLKIEFMYTPHKLRELPEITLECEYNPEQIQLDMRALIEVAIRKQMERLEKEGEMLMKAGFTPEELTIVQEGDGPQYVRPIREIE